MNLSNFKSSQKPRRRAQKERDLEMGETGCEQDERERERERETYTEMNEARETGIEKKRRGGEEAN